jgi:hypothetical protein
MRWALAHYSTGRKKKHKSSIWLPVFVLFFSPGCARPSSVGDCRPILVHLSFLTSQQRDPYF